ncbi:chromatin assembly complex protein [Phakopsora pachyrhizi]|nr:chromatin assembly complex protein [Phakopsora pachyrhizi]
MRAKAIEIRWHNTKPIYSTDFQPTTPSNLDDLLQNKSHPYTRSEQDRLTESYEKENGFGKVWRLATAGGDNMVMMWLVYPKPTIAQLRNYQTVHQLSGTSTHESSTSKTNSGIKHTNAPIVEYLATLAKHQGVVNVVRFCPKGETLASAGDDGNVLLWVLSTNRTNATTFGESTVDKIYDRESWRTRLMLRGPAQCEIYDVAWSPCGDFLLTGDTAKTARIWNVTDGLCIKQITEHSNFVQGVAWDPLGKYIATQSSDRSMNIYSLQINREESGSATAEVHYVGKNYKIDLLNQQINSWASHQNQIHGERADTNVGVISSKEKTSSLLTNASSGTKSVPSSVASSSTSRPQLGSRSISVATTISDISSSVRQENVAGLSRVASVPSNSCSAQSGGETEMQPPSEIPHHSNHSSAHQQHQVWNHSHSRQSSVVSSQTVSPASMRPIRSPSPIPPLPAIHVDEGQRTKSVLLYGDEGASAFFRRLTWSVDGSMLLTPAGRWESQFSVDSERSSSKGKAREDDRNNNSELKRKRKKKVHLGIDSTDEEVQQGEDSSKEDCTPTVFIYGRNSIAMGVSKAQGVYPPIARLPGHRTNSVSIRFSPVVYHLNPIKMDHLEIKSKTTFHPPRIELGRTLVMSEVRLDQAGGSVKKDIGDHIGTINEVISEGTEQPTGVFDLPYRMIYAVATHDSVFIYDTQQSSPICMFGNLHFSSFTDLSWTADGESLILSSSDGYCSLVSFDPNELGQPISKESLHQFPSFSLGQESSHHTQEEQRIRRHTVSTKDSESLALNSTVTQQPDVSSDPKDPKFCEDDNGRLKTTKVARRLTEEADCSKPKKKRATLTYEGPVQR